MKNINIAFDIDGVLADLNYVLKILLKKRYNIDNIDFNNYHISFPDKNLSQNIIQDMYFEIISEYLDEIPVYDKAVEAIIKFHEIYKNIVFVTSRNRLTKNYTELWINKIFNNSINFQTIYTNDKPKFLISNKFNIFVEDYAINAINISKFLNTVFLVNRPWNMNEQIPNSIIRVNDLMDVYNFLVLKD